MTTLQKGSIGEKCGAEARMIDSIRKDLGMNLCMKLTGRPWSSHFLFQPQVTFN